MASQPKQPGAKVEEFDLINRRDKSPNLPGTLTFLGLRPLVPLLQYGILAREVGSSLLHAVGLETLPAGPPNTGTPLDVLGLSPYRLAIFGMSVGATVKQLYWLLVINQTNFPPMASVFVTAFNGIFDSINSLLFTCTLTSASLSSGSKFPQTPLVVGAALYAAGIFLEAGSETQRMLFKKDAKNKGKLYSSGLWSSSRHMNYFGYTLWRAGYAIAAGGWIWGAINVAWFSFDFITRGIPGLESYCAEHVSRFRSLNLSSLLKRV
jgi:protein-S-isoprenylcysteine O-methyltransferase Ste14